MSDVIHYTDTITDNFAVREQQGIADELLLFTLADGSTITSVYVPAGHWAPHVYRINGPSGAILGEFPSLRPIIDLLDMLDPPL